MMAPKRLYATYARLPEGWRRDVLLSWDAHGILCAVQPGVPCPQGVDVARGPVLPGMPNVHSHAFQRAMAGLTEYRATAADSFWSWRELMYRFVSRVGPEDMSHIARWLYIEMLKAGYTSVCEFHYVHHPVDRRARPGGFEMAARVVAAADEVGLGMTLLPVLYQFGGFGEQAPSAAQARFLHSPDSLLNSLFALRDQYPESSTRRYGVAPHSLRAVSPASLREVLDGLHAQLPSAPVHLHIAEQQAEVDACVAAHGARPVQWLLDHAPVDERWCLVHATHVNQDERRRMADSRAVAGLCLTTEANLGDGLFPAHDYLAHGGRFAIGSDSHVAVDWRAELRLLEYGQRLLHRQRNVLASAEHPRVADRLFDEAARSGGAVTGRPIGQLAVGQCADLIVLNPEHLALAGRESDTWLSGVIFGEYGDTPISEVMVAGRTVIEGGRHPQEQAARQAFQETVARLLA